MADNPADTLRQAVAKLRQRAHASTLRQAAVFVRLVAEANTALANCCPIPKEMQGRTRAEIARADMHPAVGRALAAWLDDQAQQLESGDFPGIHEPALAVARAILGDEEEQR